jgi:hypothetical protein
MDRPTEPPRERLYAAWNFIGGYSIESFSRNAESTKRWISEQFAPANWRFVILDVFPVPDNEAKP